MADLRKSGGTFSRAILATLALGCHPIHHDEPAVPGPSCREVAIQGDRVINRVHESAREGATRFYAEAIDLCQEPGLAQRARACLAEANDLASARACPSLPATASDGASKDGAEDAPPCHDVVAHAMRILESGLDAPLAATDRAEEARLFERDCDTAAPAARRCAAAAATIDALDRCLAPSGDNRDGDSDD